MKILNLGCGTKTSDKQEVINIDWSIYLRLKRMKIIAPFVSWFIKGERLERFRSLPDNIVLHNLAKGIPYDSESVDVVYNSHMLEHLDRSVAKRFLQEARRALKLGGIHRIVVPDLERACRAYISHLSACDADPAEGRHHDSYVAALIEQSVRREGFGTGQQKPFRRLVENAVLGDARRRGETHQWMYDRINLTALLREVGYREVHLQQYNTSLVDKWNDYGLDVDKDGNPYRPGSIYVEAVK